MPLKYYVFENIMENGAFALWKMEHLLFGRNAPFSIILSKVFKTFLIFIFLFFQWCLKKENDVMI